MVEVWAEAEASEGDGDGGCVVIGGAEDEDGSDGMECDGLEVLGGNDGLELACRVVEKGEGVGARSVWKVHVRV